MDNPRNREVLRNKPAVLTCKIRIGERMGNINLLQGEKQHRRLASI
nr:MAG TPA: hypothetical protein [Caudoviricetes sp.]